MPTLSSKEKAALRGVAQQLRPAVHIGKNGLAASAVQELRKAFEREELIKVAFKAHRDELPQLIERVEQLTESQCVGGVGKRRSFYRPQPTQSQMEG
ncbi:YhbY family RNA-binding protein [Pelagicoccus sp. SDUM812003]|uniref:YhbY family RNA-binding protein n=1 Tax=Pelagicoccus sp. SDUM812003 TaxID=3041267 RepID=UPI00280D761C|nr:YhbY family RNA-binding protein [Pelagicoccus sp. SDUM812003]MDQ8203429.1 YhbY family RNA-binding protein [Pelagicoccus sp. SDUM812003]